VNGSDWLVFGPDDVDLGWSPVSRDIAEPTYVLGAFNPGMTRLPGGNLLLMVRVAEALRDPVKDGVARAIRWTPGGYVVDAHDLDGVNIADPRQFEVGWGPNHLLALTSISWLLPVELDPDGRHVVRVHYDKIIEPAATYQAYGIEDARISRIGDTWYMTTCSVSPERHCTTLHVSRDGLHYQLVGIVLDHQNKDMLLFEGHVGGRFMALTRPLGEIYFVYPRESPYAGGPAIHFATSPDALHWKPLEAPGIRARKGSLSAMKVGGGTPPILTDDGWLMIYHGVETREAVGVYRSFWALLDREDPSQVLRLEDEVPLIGSDPALTRPIAERLYMPAPIVFSTGIADAGDAYLVASGEADLACRMTRLPKSLFCLK